MVDLSQYLSGASGLFGTAGITIKWIGVGLLVGGVIYGFYAIKRRTLDFNIKVLYVRLINGIDTYGEDVGGVFTSKGKSFFKIKKANILMKGDKIPFRITDTGKKIVFLARLASKSYSFIQAKPNLKNILNKTEPDVTGVKTIDEHWQFLDGDVQGYDKLTLTVTEEDTENAVSTFKAGVKTYAQNKLLAMLPVISLTLVVVISIFVLYYVSQWVPQIASVSVTIADAIKQTAQVCSSQGIVLK